MGMSTHVVGVRDLDAKFKDMIELKLACEKAKIPYPYELDQYFNNETGESEAYLREQLEEMPIDIKKLNKVGEDTYEVDISTLPKDCKAIRFSNSY